MRKIIASAAVAAIALTAAGNASAQSFTGPSVGVQAGWSESKVRDPRTDLGRADIDASKDSFAFGGFVGYDYEVLPKVVIGAQADLNFTTGDTLRGVASGTKITLDPKRSIDLSARVGYTVTPSTLVYVRGGYTNARVRTTFTTSTATRSAGEDRDGWLVGGGVEQYIIPNVSARLEYRYSDLSDGRGTYDRHQVLAGVAYRF